MEQDQGRRQYAEDHMHAEPVLELALALHEGCALAQGVEQQGQQHEATGQAQGVA